MEVFTLMGSLALRADEYFKGLTAAEGASEKTASSIGQRFEKIGSGISSLGGKLSIGLTAPLVAAGGVAIAAATQVDEGMSIIRRSTGATGDELDGLESSFKNIAANADEPLTEVAAAMSEVEKRTGLTGAGLEALTANFLDLADVTGEDVNGLIEANTRLFGDWSVATEKQGSTLDYLYKVSQQTGIGVTQLSGSLVQFGAPLRQMGFGLEESAALLGKFEKEGVNAELVMGSLRIALGKMASEGVKDPAQALEILTERIKNAGSAGEANEIALETFGARAGPDMAAAIREGRFEVDELVKSIQKGPDTMAKAAEQGGTFAESMGELRNKATLALEPIGKLLIDALIRLIPLIEQVFKVVSNLTERFNALPGPVKEAILVFVGVLGAVGPLTAGIGALMSVLSLILGPIGLVAAAAAGLYLTIKNWDKITAVASTAWGGVKGVLGGFLNYLKGLPAQMLKIGQDIVNGLWNGIKSGANNVIGAAKNLGQNVLDSVKRVLKTRSPSKEMEAIGAFAAQGLAAGLKSGAIDVVRAAQDLASHVTSTIKNMQLSVDLGISSDADLLKTLREQEAILQKRLASTKQGTEAWRIYADQLVQVKRQIESLTDSIKTEIVYMESQADALADYAEAQNSMLEARAPQILEGLQPQIDALKVALSQVSELGFNNLSDEARQAGDDAVSALIGSLTTAPDSVKAVIQPLIEQWAQPQADALQRIINEADILGGFDALPEEAKVQGYQIVENLRAVMATAPATVKEALEPLIKDWAALGTQAGQASTEALTETWKSYNWRSLLADFRFDTGALEAWARDTFGVIPDGLQAAIDEFNTQELISSLEAGLTSAFDLPKDKLLELQGHLKKTGQDGSFAFQMIEAGIEASNQRLQGIDPSRLIEMTDQLTLTGQNLSAVGLLIQGIDFNAVDQDDLDAYDVLYAKLDTLAAQGIAGANEAATALRVGLERARTATDGQTDAVENLIPSVVVLTQKTIEQSEAEDDATKSNFKLSDAMAIAKGASELLGGAWGSLINRGVDLVSAFQSIATGGIGAFMGMLSAAQSLVSGLQNAINDWNGYNAAVKSADAAMQAAQSAVAGLEDSLGGAGLKAKLEELRRQLEYYKNMPFGLGAGMVASTEAEIKRLTELAETLGELGKNIPDILADGIYNALESGDYQGAAEEMKRRFREQILKSIIQMAVESVLASSSVGEVLESLPSRIQYAMESGDWSGVTAAINDASYFLEQDMAAMSEDMAGAMAGMFPEDMADPAIQQAKNAFGQIRDAVSSGLRDAIFEAIQSGDIGAAQEALHKKLYDSVIKSIIDIAVETVLAQGILGEKLAGMQELIASAIASGDWSAVKAQVDSIGAELDAQLGSITEGLTQTFGDWTAGVQDSANKAAASVNIDLDEKSVKPFNEAAQKLSYFADIFSPAVDKFGSFIDKFSALMEGVPQYATVTDSTGAIPASPALGDSMYALVASVQPEAIVGAGLNLAAGSEAFTATVATLTQGQREHIGALNGVVADLRATIDIQRQIVSMDGNQRLQAAKLADAAAERLDRAASRIGTAFMRR